MAELERGRLRPGTVPGRSRFGSTLKIPSETRESLGSGTAGEVTGGTSSAAVGDKGPKELLQPPLALPPPSGFSVPLHYQRIGGRRL